jgi:V/A-type H+-transporting ATPase subunit E
MADAIAAAGVDQLLTRLRDDGVKAGQEAAARLIREAEDKAAQIVAKARKAAEDDRAKVQDEIQTQHAAAQGALKLAARDATLTLRNEVRDAFEKYVQRLVIDATEDPEFIRSLILVLAGDAVEKHIRDKDAHLYLSKAIIEGEQTPEIRRRSAQFVKTLASGVLRQGITLVPCENLNGGARVRLVHEQVELDLSDAAITALLVRHIAPRFREIMSGVE